MKLPLTVYGVREILLAGVLGAAAIAICVLAGVPLLAIVPGLIMLAVLAFFRDPTRRIPDEAGAVVSPADGKIVAITEVPTEEYLERPALRIDIFLSVHNVHVNRAPLAAEVAYIADRDGPALNALKIEAGEQNRAKTVGFVAADGDFPFLVRQIVGAIARRIVCATNVGDRLDLGQRFGMLKFGSRTQLALPADVAFDVRVKVGDKVRGGATVLGTVCGRTRE